MIATSRGRVQDSFFLVGCQVRICESQRELTNVGLECLEIDILHSCMRARLLQLRDVDTAGPTNIDSSFTLELGHRQVIHRGGLLRRVVRMSM